MSLEAWLMEKWRETHCGSPTKTGGLAIVIYVSTSRQHGRSFGGMEEDVDWLGAEAPLMYATLLLVSPYIHCQLTTIERSERCL